MSSANNHLDLISINITLDPVPAAESSFAPLLIVDGTTSSLNGDQVVSYSNVSEAQAAVTAGFLSSAGLAFVTAAFAQATPGGSFAPEVVKVGRHDVGSETITVAYNAIKAADPDFYGVAMERRVATEAAELSPVVETDATTEGDRRRLLVVQSSDVDWLTAGVPAAYTGLEGKERTASHYHDTDTIPAEWAWLAGRLAFDPDLKSVGWNAPVFGVANYATDLNQTQKTQARNNNANPGLLYPPAAYFVDKGTSMTGRTLNEIYTSDWFYDRLRARIAAVAVAAATRGEKIAVSIAGQAIILAEVNALFDIGLNANHFSTDGGAPTAAGLPITNDDITNQQLRFAGSAFLSTPARRFDLDFTFTRFLG